MTYPDHPLSPESAPFGLQDFSLDPTENTSSKLDLNQMDQAELLALHSKIENKLTGLKLADVNLEKETLLQFQKAKVLQELANTTKDVPVNQLAQVQNSIRGILESLARMQAELHDSETMKRWKASLIRVIKAQPTEFQKAFFDSLEQEAEMVEREIES